MSGFVLLSKHQEEFVEMFKALQRDGKVIYRKGHMIAKKEVVMEMLGRYMYETELRKLTVWKTMKWIDTDEGRFTKRIYDKQQKKYVAAIVVNKKIYDMLKNFE